MKIRVANTLTVTRLVLGVVCFVLIGLYRYDPANNDADLMIAALVVFIIAGVTDMIDGFVARALKEESALGRILDPFVDKMLIIGTLIMFCGANFAVQLRPEQQLRFTSLTLMDPGPTWNMTLVAPWVVIVMLLRELLVTAMRTHSESQGSGFAANVAGKLKMFIQAFTIGAIMVKVARYHHQEWANQFIFVCLWVMVVTTTVSGLGYLGRIVRMLRAEDA